MNFRQMTYFIAVAEELSFRAAAERLHVSQPPVSVQIRELEQSLGVRLFERSTQKVVLTEAGEILLRRARAILRNVEDARDEMSAIAGARGVLQLGYMSAAMLYTLGPVLADFRAATGNVSLGLHQMNPDEQLRGIARGELDAGFVDFGAEGRHVGVEDETLQLHAVWHERLVAALPSDHPLADESVISPAQLADQPLITLARNPFFGFYDKVIEHLSRHARRPATIREARDLPQVLTLVAAGFGISITPELSSRPWRGRVCLVPIEPGVQTEVCLVHRAGITDPLLRQLLESAHKTMAVNLTD